MTTQDTQTSEQAEGRRRDRERDARKQAALARRRLFILEQQDRSSDELAQARHEVAQHEANVRHWTNREPKEAG